MKDYEFAQKVAKIYKNCPTTQAHQKTLELKIFLDDSSKDLDNLAKKPN